MKDVSYYVKCLMCSTEVGRIANGSFVPRSPRAEPAAYQGGLLRCSHCGGSLYLEPLDSLEPVGIYPTIDDLAELAGEIAAKAARRARRTISSEEPRSA